MSTTYESYGFSTRDPIVLDKNIPLYVGLELEIESILDNGHVPPCFCIEPDGSLRNNGMEFISPPVPVDLAIQLFSDLHAKLIVRNKDEKFSQRTSIHVHANVSNLETDEVRNIVLMYALFEEFFFMMASPDRRDNIHCVALTETFLPAYYGNSLGSMVERWHKYTALNLKPVKQQGTIEFRHMHGHDDVELLSQWLGTINNLFDVGRSVRLTEDTITKQNIDVWFNKIFGGTMLMWHKDHIDGIIYNSLTDLKVMVV